MRISPAEFQREPGGMTLQIGTTLRRSPLLLIFGSDAMPTSEEYRHRANACLELAKEANDIFACTAAGGAG